MSPNSEGEDDNPLQYLAIFYFFSTFFWKKRMHAFSRNQVYEIRGKPKLEVGGVCQGDAVPPMCRSRPPPPMPNSWCSPYTSLLNFYGDQKIKFSIQFLLQSTGCALMRRFQIRSQNSNRITFDPLFAKESRKLTK